MYLPEDSIIYDNIIDAYDRKVFEKIGNPIGFDD
jgi:hypothetical protein